MTPENGALEDEVPDRAARDRWTYAQLLADSERIATALLAQFKRRERIAI